MVFHIYQDVRSEWRWYLATPDGAKLATSGEGYARRGDCVRAIRRMTYELRHEQDAAVVDDNLGPLASTATSSGFFASMLSASVLLR